MIGEDIPEGQGAVNELLAQCFDLTYELKVQAENESGSENDTANDKDSGVHLTKE